MSTYYPENEENHSRPYYVEFNRGDKPNEFTLFKRQFMYSDEEWNKMMEKSDGTFACTLMRNEVHPWNIYTAGFGPDGCMPDKAWVRWMVDALNNSHLAEVRGKLLSAEINS